MWGIATEPTPPVITTPGADPADILWGMPLEVTVGFIGVAVGALVTGVAAFGVARWQARRQLRDARLAVLDAAATRLFERVTEVMGGPTDASLDDVFSADAAAVAARAASIAPRFAVEVDFAGRSVHRLIAAVSERAAQANVPREVSLLTDDERDKVWGLAWLVMNWWRAPEQFERVDDTYEAIVARGPEMQARTERMAYSPPWWSRASPASPTGRPPAGDTISP